MSSVVLIEAAPYRGQGTGLAAWKFWLPTALVALAVIIPDFELVNVYQAAGIYLESDLAATIATENSLREALFLLNLLSLGAVGVWLMWFGGATGTAGQQLGGRPQLFLLALMILQMALSGLSLLWSDDVNLTFRRLVITALFVLGSWGIGRAWRGLDLVRMVLWLSAGFAISGLAGEMYYGSLGSPLNYRFSGFLHPNRQAISCALFVLAALAMQQSTGKRVYWLAALVALVLVVLTGSRGGVLACLAAAAFQIFWATPPRERLVWLLLAGLLLGGGLLVFALEPGGTGWLEALGKMGRSDPQADPKSLTGRLPIWSQIIDDIRQRPTLGYGYSAYWTADRVHRLSYIHDWEFSNAHSSYLEVMLSVGLTGFVLGLLAVWCVFARGLVHFSQSRDPGLLFVLAVFVMAFVNGLVESIFVSVGYEFVVWLAGAFIIVYLPQQGRHSIQVRNRTL